MPFIIMNQKLFLITPLPFLTHKQFELFPKFLFYFSKIWNDKKMKNEEKAY